jgi:hypothetical protein
MLSDLDCMPFRDDPPEEDDVASRHPARTLPPLQPDLSWWVRAMNAAAGLSVLVMLMLAMRLQPNPTGLGTHQQLGFPPCTMIVLFNLPCPSCGMTTSWALFVRGAWGASVTTNAGGFLLAIIALAYLPASCYFCFIGRASRRGWYSFSLALALLVALAVAFGQWGWRMVCQ